ncbi:MAG: energy transducer TonB [Candidatus Eisenbacteria bacterium]|nr:energy transducer TonB [Candidatus Eisenbacteria bacterium]
MFALVLVSPAFAGQSQGRPVPDSISIAVGVKRLAGEWTVSQSTSSRMIGPDVVITDLGSGRVGLTSDKGRFVGVGLFDGSTLAAITRDRSLQLGMLRATFTTDRTLAVKLSGEGPDAWQEEVWTRGVPAHPRPNGAPIPPDLRDPLPDHEPAFGEYVYVEELPEAIYKVAPTEPNVLHWVEGTVMVQALVGKDGLVKDTRVVKSIPEDDAEAVDAVRQWRFKPAMAGGKPVAVWVAVPVRFSLH